MDCTGKRCLTSRHGELSVSCINGFTVAARSTQQIGSCGAEGARKAPAVGVQFFDVRFICCQSRHVGVACLMRRLAMRLAAVTRTARTRPRVSATMCRMRPMIFFGRSTQVDDAAGGLGVAVFGLPETAA